MVGIIYKFTIIAKYKYDGHKPFYVGQHHTKETKRKISKCNSGENNKWYKVGFSIENILKKAKIK